MMKYIIGVDVGGTKISVVLASQKGEIIEKRLLKTLTGKAAKKNLTQLLNVVDELLQKKSVRSSLLGVGVALPGFIDYKKGVIVKSPNLSGWVGLPIRDKLKKLTGKPVYLENDGNVGCLGQKYFGPAKDFDNFIYLTVSTGVGGGVFTNGCILHGADGFAGEVGHINLYPNGELCGCGLRGCLEAHASGTWLVKETKKRLKNLSNVAQKKSILYKEIEGKFETLSGKHIHAAAKKGDSLSLHILEELGDNLGVGIAALIMIFNPRAIFIGGGVSTSFQFISPSMKKSISKRTWKLSENKCKIQKATLGGKVTDLGAIALVLSNLIKK